MVADPYKALGLSHSATKSQIKVAYRKLALEYHPDRLAARNATKEEWQVASEKFASISSAYAVLSDDRRKREYDHIYKYGGYDDISQQTRSRSRQPYQQTPYREQVEDPFNPFPKTGGSKKDRRQKGVGYAISDPISYIFNKSATGGKKAVAGVHIPSRMQMVHQAPQGGGFRFSFSHGEFSTNRKTGVKKFVSRTTQIVQGKKYTKFETTTVHPDGRKEIVTEGNDFVERRSLPPSRHRKKKTSKSTNDDDEEEMVDGEGPWYMNAWSNVRDRLNSCHQPTCGDEITVQ